MNLREEIKKEIDDILVLAETNNDNTNETTDNILKLFEKRIDEMINNFEQQKKIPFKERPILIEHDLNLLRFVKEEILK